MSLFNYQNSKLIILLFIIAVLAPSIVTKQQYNQSEIQKQPSNDIPDLTQEIGQEIFHQNKIYVIYSYQYQSERVKQIFQQFCTINDHLCAYLDPENDKYSVVRSFIGFEKDQYFFIIDSVRRKKYVLPIIQDLSVSDLLIFQSKFEQQTLEPFLASQQPDSEPYQPCRKLVSKDLTQFLTSETPIKVVFLYTLHQACEICGEMLRMYADMADKMYDSTIISFGYYDIFKNDHPLITDEILPYFLVFENGNTDDPKGVSGEEFENLFNILVELVMKDVEMKPDTNKNWYQQQDLLNVQFQSMNQEEVLLEDLDLGSLDLDNFEGGKDLNQQNEANEDL